MILQKKRNRPLKRKKEVDKGAKAKGSDWTGLALTGTGLETEKSGHFACVSGLLAL